jgi:ribosomal protein S18 acetylase RimI-like enzyme
MLVGELNGKVVAMGGVRRVDEATCELLRMRVYPEYQGRGYGSLVLDRLEGEAARLGYRRATLITGEDQHPAVDLYRSRGYRVDRRETLVGIPSVHMSKNLASTPTDATAAPALVSGFT